MFQLKKISGFHSSFTNSVKEKREAFQNQKKTKEHKDQTHFHCGCFYAQPPKTQPKI